jgi:hypothetical protein
MEVQADQMVMAAELVGHSVECREVVKEEVRTAAAVEVMRVPEHQGATMVEQVMQVVPGAPQGAQMETAEVPMEGRRGELMVAVEEAKEAEAKEAAVAEAKVVVETVEVRVVVETLAEQKEGAETAAMGVAVVV